MAQGNPGRGAYMVPRLCSTCKVLARLQGEDVSRIADDRHVRCQKLPRRDREEIRERFRRYRELSPERRAQLREAIRAMLRAPPGERGRMLENLRRWRELSPDQRERLREEWRRRRER